MDTDEVAPTPKPARLDLEVLSVEALTQRIADLETEIATIHALIDTKRRSRNAADAIFKS